MRCELFDHVIGSAFAVIECSPPIEPWWRTVISVATPLLVLASAIIAWRSLRNTRAVARQKATLDLIEKAESNEHYRALSLCFAAVRKARGFPALHDPKTNADKKLRQDVLDYLNHYELVAIGIRHDILDETIYRSWMQSHVVAEWNAASDFIQSERWRLTRDGTDYEYRTAIFENLQNAVCRWSKDARRLTEASSPKPALTTGPVAAGDEPLPEVGPPNVARPADPT